MALDCRKRAAVLALSDSGRLQLANGGKTLRQKVEQMRRALQARNYPLTRLEVKPEQKQQERGGDAKAAEGRRKQPAAGGSIGVVPGGGGKGGGGGAPPARDSGPGSRPPPRDAAAARPTPGAPARAAPGPRRDAPGPAPGAAGRRPEEPRQLPGPRGAPGRARSPQEAPRAGGGRAGDAGTGVADRALAEVPPKLSRRIISLQERGLLQRRLPADFWRGIRVGGNSGGTAPTPSYALYAHTHARVPQEVRYSVSIDMLNEFESRAGRGGVRPLDEESRLISALLQEARATQPQAGRRARSRSRWVAMGGETPLGSSLSVMFWPVRCQVPAAEGAGQAQVSSTPPRWPRAPSA